MNEITLTVQQTEKLLLGNYTFSHLSFSMMLMSMKSIYAKNPSQLMLESCTNEIRNFLEKFKKSIGSDYAIIEKI